VLLGFAAHNETAIRKAFTNGVLLGSDKTAKPFATESLRTGEF